MLPYDEDSMYVWPWRALIWEDIGFVFFFSLFFPVNLYLLSPK